MLIRESNEKIRKYLSLSKFNIPRKINGIIKKNEIGKVNKYLEELFVFVLDSNRPKVKSLILLYDIFIGTIIIKKIITQNVKVNFVVCFLFIKFIDYL